MPTNPAFQRKIDACIAASAPKIYELLSGETNRVMVTLKIQSESHAVKTEFRYGRNNLSAQNKPVNSLEDFQDKLTTYLKTWSQPATYPFEIQLYVNSDRVSSKLIISNANQYF